MEYLVDTANIIETKEAFDYYPISGVTTNPTILKKEFPKNVSEHLLSLRKLCGNNPLHVQLCAPDCDLMVIEAENYIQLLGKEIYLKIPSNKEGIKAIKRLKKQGRNVTATAIYYQLQGLIAIEAGADYIAPYCNRMENNDISFTQLIAGFRNIIDRDHYSCKILAASFKNITQVNKAILSGAHAVTVQPDLLQSATDTPLVSAAISAFEKDQKSLLV